MNVLSRPGGEVGHGEWGCGPVVTLQEGRNLPENWSAKERSAMTYNSPRHRSQKYVPFAGERQSRSALRAALNKASVRHCRTRMQRLTVNRPQILQPCRPPFRFSTLNWVHIYSNVGVRLAGGSHKPCAACGDLTYNPHADWSSISDQSLPISPQARRYPLCLGRKITEDIVAAGEGINRFEYVGYTATYC